MDNQVIDAVMARDYPELTMSMFASADLYAKAQAEQIASLKKALRSTAHLQDTTAQALVVSEMVLKQQRAGKDDAQKEGLSDAFAFWPSLAACFVAALCFGWRPWG